ncbi:hypothetical protein LRS10_06950 [Phenylobacterium sp. J426]|uniref:hypothetical protein n=1 Tax=Phenylobacterium sp. J426 TaxID=2898439 RepID=UPI002151F55E|nr:hypothetical protein [Phenylobacterium sp. J426]MCR5873931.1 hypothetical protein [Phenylobacterium sp. J426]
MNHILDLPELEREIADAPDFDAFEAALRKLTDLRQGFREPGVYGQKLYLKGLDDLIPTITRGLSLPDVPGERSNAQVVILATRFYRTGGHSQVAFDVARRLGPDAVTVIFTATDEGELSYRKLLGGPHRTEQLQERASLVLSSATLTERILELYRLLLALRPTRIILMSHPTDVVAVAGAWPFRAVTEFLHHADHVPALGATLPFARHVDLTFTCHQACRAAGLAAEYAGQAAPAAADAASERAPGKVLRLATCGSPHKYAGRRGHAWRDYAAAALRRPAAELIHIGTADEAMRQDIRSALEAAGVDPQRYVFAGVVPSLGRALVERDIDVYLSSYPETGARANLEAMAAGIPVVLPVAPDDEAPLTRFSLPLRRWIEARTPDDLPAAIDQALALSPSLRTPEAHAELRRELARFDDYVALRPLAPV